MDIGPFCGMHGGEKRRRRKGQTNERGLQCMDCLLVSILTNFLYTLVGRTTTWVPPSVVLSSSRVLYVGQYIVDLLSGCVLWYACGWKGRFGKVHCEWMGE